MGHTMYPTDVELVDERLAWEEETQATPIEVERLRQRLGNTEADDVTSPAGMYLLRERVRAADADLQAEFRRRFVWVNDGSCEPEIAGMAICGPCADEPRPDDDPHPATVEGWELVEASCEHVCDVCGRSAARA